MRLNCNSARHYEADLRAGNAQFAATNAIRFVERLIDAWSVPTNMIVTNLPLINPERR